MTNFFTFKRGYEILEYKKNSLSFYGNAFLPNKAFIPISFKDGTECSPLVSAGERVNEGQLIAEGKQNKAVKVHASIPGIISGFVSFYLNDGKEINSIAIKLKGALDILGKPVPSYPWKNTSGFELIKIIERAGVINTALRYALPLSEQISSAAKAKISTLQVNLFDKCPSCQIDSFLTENMSLKVAEGISIIAKLLGVKRIICLHKIQNKNVLSEFSNLLSANSEINTGFTKVKNSYPFEDFNIPFGTVFQIDAATAVYTYEAVVNDYPMTAVYISVEGKTLNEAKIVKARIGTPIGNLLEECGGVKNLPEGVIINGVTRGYAVNNFDIPVEKNMKSLHVVGKEVLKPLCEFECVDCGKCFNSCPMYIDPIKIVKSIEKREFTKEVKESMMMCNGCSCCSIACPAKIPLAHKIEAAGIEFNTKKEII